MTRQAPRALLAVTAPLRREARPGWAAVRLALYAAAVLGTGWRVLSGGAPLWIAAVITAACAVVLLPVALLAVECLRSPGRGTRRKIASRVH